MIGSRLKLARDILDITQEQLGEMIGTTQSGVASMESGLYRPSAEYLQMISRKTDFTPEFFQKGELPEFPFGSILYRSQVSVKQNARTRAHAIAHAAFELAIDLGSRLKKIAINIPKLDDDPETCAQIARASLGLSPNSPIRGLIKALERSGVLIISLPLDIAGFDGFSAWAGHDPARPVIALLQGKTAFREESTVAEEFAHLVMHSPLRTNAAEADKEARRFALELLLPSETMMAEMQPPVTLSSLSAMKPRWGVSIAFLAKRAESLNLITNNQYRYLCQQMRSRWGSKSEPGDHLVTPERPALLRKMGEMLYGKPIDVPKMAKDSGVPVPLIRGVLGIETVPARVLEFKR